MDWNPNNRAFTGGVGKPTRKRHNDGRQVPPSDMGLQYAVKTLPRPAGIYGKLEPYADNNPVTRVVKRAPEWMSPYQRKMWHKMQRIKSLLGE